MKTLAILHGYCLWIKQLPMPVEKPVTTTCEFWGPTTHVHISVWTAWPWGWRYYDVSIRNCNLMTQHNILGDINLCQYCCENFTSCTPQAIAEHIHDSPKINMWCGLMHDVIIHRENNIVTCSNYLGCVWVFYVESLFMVLLIIISKAVFGISCNILVLFQALFMSTLSKF